MGSWVKVCEINQAPGEGQVMEADAAGTQLCLARLGGEVRALDNLCPHRQGPLGQGWIEGENVVCPWHSWAFSCRTGLAEFPEGERVAVYPVKLEDDAVWVSLGPG